MGCFLILLELNGQLLENHTRPQKKKRRQNDQCIHFKVSQYYQRIILLLDTTGLKIISRQEKHLPRAVSKIHFW